MYPRSTMHQKLLLKYMVVCFGVFLIILNMSLWISKSNHTNVEKTGADVHSLLSSQLIKLLQDKGFSGFDNFITKKKFDNQVSFTKEFYEMFRKGIKVDMFSDVCLEKVMYNLKWHPLFPYMPSYRTVYQKLEDEKIIQYGYARRIYGYLISERTGDFEFLVKSRDGVEISIRETSVELKQIEQLLENKVFENVAHVILDENEISKQLESIPNCYMFEKKFRLVLKSHKIYYIDILQGGVNYGQMKIQWRLFDDEAFEPIGDGNLFHFNAVKHTDEFYPISQHFQRPVERYSYNENEARRMNFMNVQQLPNNFIRDIQKCERHHLPPGKIDNMYDGIRVIDNFLVYPQEHFEFTSNSKPETLVINKEEGEKFAREVYLQNLLSSNKRIEFANVVHLQKNILQSNEEITNWKSKIYFGEIDVKVDGTLYRYSRFFQYNHEQNKICMMQDFQWKEGVKIHIITPVRNQAKWVKHLINNIQEIESKTKDTQLVLHIVDFESSDANLEELLKHSKLKYVYSNMVSEKFNKVKAINTALNDIPSDEIAFIVDLHLVLPLNIFDRIRKLTVQGKTAYCPTLLKLGCGEHEQYTELHNSEWMDIGYGMVSMYTSDWERVGGMNEKQFGAKWGGEDWELVDRIVLHGLFMIHMRLPRFYHIHHSNKGLWDGRKYS